MTMNHIGSLLKKNIKQSGLAKQVETSLVIEEFETIIREIFDLAVLNKFQSIYLKNKTLYVSCGSSVIMQELNFQKEEILNRINKKFNQSILKEIRLLI